MAKFLQIPFIDAADVIRFNEAGEYDDAATMALLAPKLLEPTFERAVIPGFYGAMVTPDGPVVKTFSRGGSDITGSIVAKAAKADVYENWTDVSGFLLTDNRIVKDAAPIDYITYRELRELSYMGATVLHDEAIFPVQQVDIPIHIKNTNAPQDPGTQIVGRTVHKTPHTITGIAGKKGFCSITIEKDRMNSQIGFGRKVLQAFEDHEISFEHMPSGIDTMTVFVDQEHFIPKEQSIISDIRHLVNPDEIEIEADLALIAVVGRGMKSAHGTAAKIFGALSDAKVNVKMIDQGSSELNVIIGVRDVDFETAIRAIYQAFVV
jgi:aspartate kinase